MICKTDLLIRIEQLEENMKRLKGLLEISDNASEQVDAAATKQPEKVYYKDEREVLEGLLRGEYIYHDVWDADSYIDMSPAGIVRQHSEGGGLLTDFLDLVFNTNGYYTLK